MLSKKCLACISRKHKPFLQLSRLDKFTINAIANFFVHEKMKIPEVYSEHSRTSRMELFVNLVYSQQLLTISAKYSILDVRLDFEYVSASFVRETFYTFREGSFVGKQ